MQTLDELLSKLSKANLFTTFDAKDGLYQVGLPHSKVTFWN